MLLPVMQDSHNCLPLPNETVQLFAFPGDMYLCLTLSSLGSRGRPGIGSKFKQVSFKSAVNSILLDKSLKKIHPKTMIAYK